MRVMALFLISFFAKCLRVGEDGPGQGHLCHTDTFLVIYYFSDKMRPAISSELSDIQTIRIKCQASFFS